jgi:hypothetical protein
VLAAVVTNTFKSVTASGTTAVAAASFFLVFKKRSPQFKLYQPCQSKGILSG